MRVMKRPAPLLLPAALLLLGLAACHSQSGGNGNVPGDTSYNAPFREISPNDELHFVGTEPFWGGKARGGALTYTTPEDPDGQSISVSRFAGRGGIALSGKFHGQTFDMAVTEGECSDGMSDKTYPFTVTLHVEGNIRDGCAWSDKHPISGPAKP